MKKKKPLTRSQNMARIKSKNTKPEIYIRKLLYKMGYRYRVNYSELPGTPDIFILKYNTAIFVNGCFWHRHENCKIATFPKTHTEYWEKKFRRNVERDIEVRENLFEMDISVITIWECEINKMQRNEEYKKKYFNSLEEFEKYFKDYYPDSFSIKHVNFEAIGDYYVVETDIIANNSNEDNKNKKGLYFVFREYDFNDYVFSFSKNK